MATTNIDLSVDMLKKSLAANGLPQYGTKDQMLARLLGGGEKKKPGPKSKGDGTMPKKRKATSKPAMFDQAEINFYAAERPRLVAQGITDSRKQSNELARRWALMKKQASSPAAKVAKTSPAVKSMIKLPTQLDAAMLASNSLEFTGVETNAAGAMLFVYTKKSSGAGGAVQTPKRVHSTVADMPDDCNDGNDDDDDDDDDDDGMSWPCEVSSERLAKKAKKEHLVALCGDFGIPTTGSKAKLAEMLAEQLHYETDDESGDDESGDDE